MELIHWWTQHFQCIILNIALKNSRYIFKFKYFRLKTFLKEYFGNISARGKKMVWYARWRGSKKGSIFVWLTVNPEFSGKSYDWPWNYFSLRWIEYKIWKNEGVMLRIQNCSSLQLEKLYEIMLNPCSRIFENHESFLPSPIW